jgi:membrane fusion protein (multidrug efflux system)
MGILGTRPVLRIVLVLALLLGAAAGGTYLYLAAGNGTAPAEAVAAGDASDDSSASGSASADGDADAEGQAADAKDEKGQDEKGKTPVPVSVTMVGKGSVSTYISAVANLVPENEVDVLAEAEGRVTQLLVEEGDAVEKGQLLAALLRDEAEMAANKARLTADNARMAWERAQRMHADELISDEEFDKLTKDHRIAQQELAQAEWKLEKTGIRSPFAGRVTMRDCTLGQHVRPGDALFRVTDFDPLIARIYLPERDVFALDEGRPVAITLKADESVGFAGVIRQISSVVDTATGTVKVTVAALDPPRTVRPGGFVTIDVTRETREDVLVLPRDAVLRELQKAHVFVAQDDKAVRRAVTLGLEEDDNVEILAGLTVGERVVVAGQGGLEDGAPIKILPDEGQADEGQADEAQASVEPGAGTDQG